MKLDVFIDSITGTQMAAKINGKFVLNDEKFRFYAIAFGRIGGQNVVAKLSDATKRELKNMGYDADEVVMLLQMNLLQGDLHLPDGLKKESFIDDE